MTASVSELLRVCVGLTEGTLKKKLKKMFFLYVFLILLLVTLVVRRWKLRKMIKLHEILGTDFACWPVLGHAYKFIGNNEDRMQCFQEFARQAYNNAHGIVTFWMTNFFCVFVISEPKSANVVMKSCLDKGPLIELAIHLVGRGSLFAPLDIWRVRRKIMSQTLTPRHVDKFIGVFERNSQVMVDKLAGVVGKGNFSAWDYLCSYSLDTSCETVMGENEHFQQRRDHPFYIAFVGYMDNMAARLCQPWFYNNRTYKLVAASKENVSYKRIMWGFLEKHISRRRNIIKENNNIHDNEKASFQEDYIKTLLELTIEYSGGERGYSDTELREEALVLMLATTDTTASSACFTMLLLSQHQDVQHKLYEEISNTFEDFNRPISLSDLTKLKYMDAVIKESLRLFPPGPMIIRMCDKDVLLPSGITIPKGNHVVVNIWGINRNPQYWGADADHFRPERFFDVTPEQLNAFVSFSYGPRNCPGYRYAMLSIKMSLVRVLQRYHITPAADFKYDQQNPLRVKFSLTMKHVDDYQIQLENRS